MSFKVNWPVFSPEFIESAKTQLSAALNKGDETPANIVDDIVVKELDMGKKPPELEILEIGELAEDKFRGIFKLTYSGDGYIVLQTKVQANPLTTPRHSMHINPRQGILAAHQPLVVPMQLRISNLRLRGICVLVIDKHRGVTLAFKNDPLEKVDVSSTFDNIPNIRRFLQNQIEQQLRKLFQENLPIMIHTMSLRYIHSRSNHTSSSSIYSTSSIHSQNGKPPLPHLRPSDSGYIPSTYDFPSRWYGNDTKDHEEGYVLYKSLNLGGRGPDRGLHRLFEPDQEIQGSVLRHKVMHRLSKTSETMSQYGGSGTWSRTRTSSGGSIASCPPAPTGSQSYLYDQQRSYASSTSYSSSNVFQMEPKRQPPRLTRIYKSSDSLPIPRHVPSTLNWETQSSPAREETFNTSAQDLSASFSDYHPHSSASSPPRSITLPPTNTFATHLATLASGYQTISPYVSLFEEEHFKFRSSPRKGYRSGEFDVGNGDRRGGDRGNVPKRVKKWRIKVTGLGACA